MTAFWLLIVDTRGLDRTCTVPSVCKSSRNDAKSADLVAMLNTPPNAETAVLLIKLLPAGGKRDNRVDGVILSASVALIAAGALPTMMGFAGRPAMILAAGLGAVMLVNGIRLARNPDAAIAARRVMFASLIYLPVVFLVLVIDRIH